MAGRRNAPAVDDAAAKAAKAERIRQSQESYITVPERIAAFKEAHPAGILGKVTEPYFMTTPQGQTFVVYGAKATPDPVTHPDVYGEGWAWEPVPGLTTYTKNSELQNAETAAWGRAIASLGFAVHRGIATADETRAREYERDSGAHLADDTGPPLEAQRQSLETLVAELTELREQPWLEEVIAPWVEANANGQTIEDLNRGQWRTLLAKVERMVEKLREEVGAETVEDAATGEKVKAAPAEPAE